MTDETDDLKWVRPCTKIESFFEVLHQHQLMLTSYSLTINSKKPLLEYHMQRSLLHLLRKVPTLSVCLRPNNGNMWFHQMEHEKVDFKILKNADFNKEFYSLTTRHYNSEEGPLWCTRLLPCSLNEKCPMPDLKNSFPNQYKLLFGFHHSITDGHSSMNICQFFLNILNDVISGRPVNDHEKLAVHTGQEFAEKQIAETMTEMESNAEEFDRISNIIEPNVDILFFKAFPPPIGATSRTLSIVRDLGDDCTSRFLKRSKLEGVSLHAAFTTIANATIVELLHNAGFQQDLYAIPGKHVINNRKFWNKIDTSRDFGCHIDQLTSTSECGSDICDNFWNYAKKLNESFQEALKDRQPLKEGIVMMKSMPANMTSDNLLQMVTAAPKTYYHITNMGNLNSILPGVGEHAQYTSIQRTTSTKGTIGSHVLQTFRGRLLYGFDYNTALITRENAEIYVNTLINILKSVI